MHSAAIVAILVCLETVGPPDFSEECKYFLNSAVQKMENYDTLDAPKKVTAVEDTKKAVKTFVHLKCQDVKENKECESTGFSYGAVLWNAILDAAQELRKSHTA